MVLQAICARCVPPGGQRGPARRARARVPDTPTRRYMTRIARIPLRDTPLAWRRRNRVSGFGKSWGVLCLSSSTTLKAGSVAPQATIRRSAAEEEKCRLTLVETCDTAHPKRQNAAERGRALYRGRTRAERFCNRCGFIKRAPRDGATRRWVALWALCARASLCGCALAASARARALALSGLVALRSRRLVPFRHGDNRCAAVFSLPHAMLVNIDVVIKTWR